MTNTPSYNGIGSRSKTASLFLRSSRNQRIKMKRISILVV